MEDYLNDYVIMVYFMFLRILSFCLDKINSQAKCKLPKYDFIDFISYIYYPTFVLTSPFISSQNFELCKRKYVEYESKLREAFTLVVRIVFSCLIYEAVLHTTSVFMIHAYSKQMIARFSSPSLIIAIMLKGFLFTSKYIVFYGTTTLINRFVGMRVTPLPRCISLMHTNAELWR